MKKSILGVAMLLAALATATAAAAKPRTIALREASLAAAKAELDRGETRLVTPLAQLRAEADELLKRKPASVLDKTQVAASGDHHDYFSFAPYWWPDPKKPDGLPYLRRDSFTTHPATSPFRSNAIECWRSRRIGGRVNLVRDSSTAPQKRDHGPRTLERFPPLVSGGFFTGRSPLNRRPGPV
jgi:hypothetical protein